eukprot:jgi/Antlo1/1611/473
MCSYILTLFMGAYFQRVPSAGLHAAQCFCKTESGSLLHTLLQCLPAHWKLSHARICSDNAHRSLCVQNKKNLSITFSLNKTLVVFA